MPFLIRRNSAFLPALRIVDVLDADEICQDLHTDPLLPGFFLDLKNLEIHNNSMVILKVEIFLATKGADAQPAPTK